MNKWGRAELMVIAAVRYCIGRQTYIVSDCVDWLIHYWPEFSDNTKATIKRDLESEFERDDEVLAFSTQTTYRPLGSSMDRASWERVRALWQK